MCIVSSSLFKRYAVTVGRTSIETQRGRYVLCLHSVPSSSVLKIGSVEITEICVIIALGGGHSRFHTAVYTVLTLCCIDSIVICLSLEMFSHSYFQSDFMRG